MRGNRSSKQSQYLYTFRYDDCLGVSKNESGIETTLIVQVIIFPSFKSEFVRMHRIASECVRMRQIASECA